jgi:hypothetical protein
MDLFSMGFDADSVREALASSVRSLQQTLHVCRSDMDWYVMCALCTLVGCSLYFIYMQTLPVWAYPIFSVPLLGLRGCVAFVITSFLDRVVLFHCATRDMFLRTSHQMMMLVSQWDHQASVQNCAHVDADCNLCLQFYQRNFFRSKLFPAHELKGEDIYDDAFHICPRICLSGCENSDMCFYDPMKSNFYTVFSNATKALTETIASYQPQFNAVIQQIRQVKESFRMQAIAIHSANETEIRALFYSNHRSLLDVRSSASEFMCLVRFDSKYIAHFHAITMLNCIFILLVVFFMHLWLRSKLRRLHSWNAWFSNVFEALFALAIVVPLFSCLFWPVPLVRNIPVHFQQLCSEVNSVSKLMADTFEPYM